MGPTRRRSTILLTVLALAVAGLVAAAVPGDAAASAWTISANQQLPGVVPSGLAATSCVSSDFCMAVNGDVFDQWDGTSWTSTPGPDNNGQLSLTGVSCSSPSFCLAVGNNGGQSAVGETWNGASWTPMTIGVPTPAPNEAVQLGAVSCLSASFCAVVGDGFHTYPAPTVVEAFLDTWNGSTWATTMIPPDPDSLEPFTGVSCVSTTFCMAVGWSGNPAGTLSYYWNGAEWTQAVMPATGGVMHGVSCVTSAFCDAVGTRGTALLAERWNGSTWTVQSPSSPAASSTLNGVDCLSTVLCYAVGGKGTKHQSLIDVYNGSTWTLATAPASAAAGALNGVSCVTGTQCEAVGSGIDATQHPFALVESTYQPAVSAVPTVTVAASTTALVDGSPLTLTATVSPSDGSGTVTFVDANTPAVLAGCSAVPLVQVGSSYQATCTTTLGTPNGSVQPNQPQQIDADFTGTAALLPNAGAVTVVAYSNDDETDYYPPTSPAFKYVTLKLPKTSLKGTLSWKVISGALPAGLTLNSSDGQITGTPAPSDSTCYIGVSETTGTKQTYLEHVHFDFTPLMAPAVYEDVSVAEHFSVALKATGGKGTLHWSAAPGALPAGVTLSSSGTLAGAISAPGDYQFAVSVHDADTPTAQVATDQIDVDIAPIIITPYEAPNGQVGVQYSSTEFQALGGKTPDTWSFSGALPPGLHLTSSVTGYSLGGTPTTAGVYSFTIQVADSSNPANVATLPCTVTIAS